MKGYAARLAAALLFVATTALAQTPPAEDFARHEQMGSLRFSPDGKHFAAISESGGVMRLVVVDFETMKGRSFVADRGADVGSFRWLTNDIIQLRTTRRGARQFDLSWADFYFFDADGRLLVLSNVATGRLALHRYDPATGKPGELLAGHPQADIGPGDLLYKQGTDEVIGVKLEGDKPQTYWFDDKPAAIQRTIDASLPADRANALQFLPNGKVLVHSTGPREPGMYYFYDPQAKSLAEWARTRPWLKPEQLGVTEIVRYHARDGLEIPAYLTVPPGGASRPLPLVVWVHGGPEARDEWEFDDIVQFLATRGYAVLQPNFRGSTGYGLPFRAAGFRQWGRAMQDDVTDGVQWLIAHGRVDPQRVCIGGGSYGGYAALMGVIREPQLFKCAIDMYGPVDLTWVVDLPEADYNAYEAFRESERSLKREVGDPDDPAQRPAMDAHSPRLQAKRVRAPIMLVYGTDDGRVPLRHGTAMRDALKDAGADVEWYSYAGEGHGVLEVKNNTEILQRIERFLARHLSTPASTPPPAQAAR